VQAGWGLVGPSRERAASAARWILYAAAGFLAGATLGPWVVLVLIGSGLLEILFRRAGHEHAAFHAWPAAAIAVGAISGGVGALAWVAFKVGALSYGGGFVIVPLMQRDAVDTYGWMSGAEFLNAVALGQVTPGPVTHTIAVVGWAAGGVAGALIGTAIAFVPSFAFVLLGARHFEDLRASTVAQGFLGGAGPAAIGAILGVSIPLALALQEGWQLAVLAGAALALLALRWGVVPTLLTAGAVGVAVALAGGPVPG
jgi:chromate transporter